MPLTRSPLFWYAAVTLGIPLLNGAEGRTGFAEHAVTVAAAIGLVAGLRYVAGRFRRLTRRQPGLSQ